MFDLDTYEYMLVPWEFMLKSGIILLKHIKACFKRFTYVSEQMGIHVLSYTQNFDNNQFTIQF